MSGCSELSYDTAHDAPLKCRIDPEQSPYTCMLPEHKPVWRGREVIDLLARACEPGLTAMPSGRFYGFVIGGTHPAALAADWLVSAWDQNAGLRQPTPALVAVEDVAKGWLLDVLGLPADSGVGFVTGATMSNFACLAAARDAVLHKAGWQVATDGLSGAPRTSSASCGPPRCSAGSSSPPSTCSRCWGTARWRSASPSCRPT